MPVSPCLRLALPLTLLLAGLSACSSAPAPQSWLETISPYRIDRVQGNVITREQYEALKSGMPRAVVKDILGTPLLTSVFHADRWDYVFTFRRQGAAPQERRVTLYFKGDVLDHFEADALPSEAEFVATLKSVPTEGKLPAMEASKESLQKFPPAAAPAAAEQSPAKAPANYPPLEPASR